MSVTYYEDETIIGKCSHGFKMITGILNAGTYLDTGIAMDLSKKIPIQVHYVNFDGNGGYVGQYDYTNSVVKIYWGTTVDKALHLVASGTDLSAVDMHFVAIGK